MSNILFQVLIDKEDVRELRLLREKLERRCGTVWYRSDEDRDLEMGLRALERLLKEFENDPPL